MVFATCERTQQASKKWHLCLISNLNFGSSTFFALPEKLAFVALPLSEYSLTYSGPPTAHQFHAWEAQLPGGLSTLFARPNQTTAGAQQTLAVLKALG